MDDAAGRIDQEHPGADAIERIGQGCRFRFLEIDHFANKNRSPKVWRYKPHAAACFRIEKPVALMAK